MDKENVQLDVLDAATLLHRVVALVNARLFFGERRRTVLQIQNNERCCIPVIQVVRNDILNHLRKHKSITVQPCRVLWVEAHELIEENVRNGSHAHGGAGMT